MSVGLHSPDYQVLIPILFYFDFISFSFGLRFHHICYSSLISLVPDFLYYFHSFAYPFQTPSFFIFSLSFIISRTPFSLSRLFLIDAKHRL